MFMPDVEGIEDIDDVGVEDFIAIEGDDFAPLLVVGSISPEGTPPSDGNGCPGASTYCDSAASCFCVASDTEELYPLSARLPYRW
jgi:hypothetical protein